jgi:fatty acid desaturase
MDAAFAPAEFSELGAVKALATRSNGAGLVRLATHVLALGASTGLLVVVPSGGWLVPAMLLHGVLLIFLFPSLHETIHGTAFRTSALNHWTAWVTGAVLILPPRYFRAFHFAHHRYTQIPGRDPELAAPKPATLLDYGWVLSGIPYWRERVTTTVRIAFGGPTEDFVSARERAPVIREARIYVVVYAVAIAVSAGIGSWAIALYWLGPVLLGQPALRLFLLAEHTGCPEGSSMLSNTRTTRSNALARWFTWNMSYHSAHHAFPAVPFHALPALHRILAPQITCSATGYMSFHRALLRSLSGGSQPAAGPTGR